MHKFPGYTLAIALGFATLANCGVTHAATYKVLHSFSFSDIGYDPTGDLGFDADGDVYGTTAIGNQSGTVFRYKPATDTFKYLVSFNGSGDGAKPQGSLVLAGGSLYGTTALGGASNAGTVYRLDLASFVLTTLHTFDGATDGASSYGGLTLRGGELFGVTLVEGPGKGGTLYKVRLSVPKLTTLHAFNAHGPNAPVGNVAFDSAGVLYGVDELYSRTYTGAIYSYDPATRKLAILHVFTEKKMGAVPFAGVAVFKNALYGTTYRGGQHNFGTVWKYDLVKKAFTVLHSFAGVADGEQPQARPAITSGGLLYGTAYAGGAYNDGTVYQINLQTAKFSVVHNFQGPDGQYPEAGIALGHGGALYGTAALGGSGGGGVLFSITP